MKIVSNCRSKATGKKYSAVTGLGLSLSLCLLLGGCGFTNANPEAPALTTSVSVPESTVSSPVSAPASQVQSIPAQEQTSSTQVQAQVQTSATENQTLSILMVGDVLLHTPVEKSALQPDGSYDYSELFTHTKKYIEAADIAIANQEVIIGGEALGVSGYPAFNAPDAIGDALCDAGFDVVCHGTNHALDKGKKGLTHCLSYWKTTHPEISVLGIHDSEADRDSICLRDANGIRVALLNYTYGTNGISLPSDMPFAVDYLDESRVKADLQKAEKEADFTIVFPHWGTEYTLKETSFQHKWADIFYENGADLVIGTHPHVIEPIEMMQKDDGREMLVYYSLGNYVNWTSGSGTGVANRMVGGMATVTLQKEADGTVSIDDYGVIPIIAHVTSGTNGVTVYPLDEYTRELGDQNEIRSRDAAFSYEYCQNLCSNVFGENYDCTRN